MPKLPTIIGLTGSLASGKSTVGAIFSELNVEVLDTDKLVHTLQQTSTIETAKIVAHFGKNILDTHGNVDRSKLANKLLKTPEKLTKLQEILFPSLKKFIIKHIDTTIFPYMVIEAPLLFEAGLDELCNEIIFCTCPPKIRRQRALQRPRMTSEKYNLLTTHQMSDSDFLKKCSLTIKTDCSQQETNQQVLDIIKEYLP